MNMENNNYGLPNSMFKSWEHLTTAHMATFSSSSSSSESENEDTALDKTDTNMYYKNSLSSLKPVNKFSSNLKLTYEVVKQIEMDLDLHDTVSLVFLLYDKHIALNVIYALVFSEPKTFSRNKISEWARSGIYNWSIMLIEALSVIQNYIILERMGYNKKEVCIHFHPTKDATLYLDRVKKVLYMLCEYLTKDQAKELIERVRRDARFKDDNITQHCDPVFLELHILFWISREYINIDELVGLKNLTKHLKGMDLLDKAEEIDNFSMSFNNQMKDVSDYSGLDEDDVYTIKDPSNVGVCIVVNMDEFKRNVEKRKEFKHLLPEHLFDDRIGSIEDVKNLKQTFTDLKFTVVEIHNIFHDKLKEEIQHLVTKHFKPNVHSMLFLCILSHGWEGVIYAANNISVSIEDIQSCITEHSSLANVPKVIIIQACQGKDFLYVEPKIGLKMDRKIFQSNLLNIDGNRSHLDDNQLCSDGPEYFHSKHADILICMAIIKGFVAVRSMKTGSVYIQEMCECIKKHYQKDHFVDIVTKVHDILNSKKMHIKEKNLPQRNCSEHPNCRIIYMTPEKKSTFRKKLYLTKKVKSSNLNLSSGLS